MTLKSRNVQSMIVKRCDWHSGRTLDARTNRSEVNEIPSDLPLVKQSIDNRL